jgi:hypothetical protein
MHRYNEVIIYEHLNMYNIYLSYVIILLCETAKRERNRIENQNGNLYDNLYMIQQILIKLIHVLNYI